MLNKSVKIIVLIVLISMLLIFSGCSVDDEVVNNDIANEIQNSEKVENNSQESDSKKITEQEALDIGYELYSYGIYPQYYDSETNLSYTGKSRKAQVYEESITFDEHYLGYPFGTNEDVENYFSEKRIKELENQTDPYRIKKIDGVWYLGQPGVGSDFSYIGTVLTIKELDKNKVVFNATDYNSWDYVEQGEPDYEKYQNKKIYEYIEEFKTKYECETEEHDFVIINENGNWKIDEQVIAHY